MCVCVCVFDVCVMCVCVCVCVCVCLSVVREHCEKHGTLGRLADRCLPHPSLESSRFSDVRSEYTQKQTCVTVTRPLQNICVHIAHKQLTAYSLLTQSNLAEGEPAYKHDSLFINGLLIAYSDRFPSEQETLVTAEHPYPPTVHSTSPTASRPIPSYPPTPTRSLETLHNIPQTKESSIAGGSGMYGGGRTSHDTHIAKYSCLRAYESAPARRPFGGLATVSADNCQENLPFVQKVEGNHQISRPPVRRRRRGGRGEGRARRGHGRGRLGRGAPYPPTLRGPPPRPLDPYPPPLLPLLPP